MPRDFRTSADRRLVTVGAYERDNFGDLLFLLVTERYLSGYQIIPAAPFAADMTALLDRRVRAVGDELRGAEAEVVWTVGGEVGGTSPASAFRMSKPAAEYAAFAEAAPEVQAKLLREAFNGEPGASPYIPTIGAFERNAAAVTVLNSVGLSGVARIAGPRRAEVLHTLRTADVVSVRDRLSSEVLTQHGISHTLSPDVVHVLGRLEPYTPDPTSDVAVVQASTRLLERFGHTRFARRLVSSPGLAGLRFRLLLAGAATGHDSLDDLERLATEIREADPHREVEIDTRRRPMDVVDGIRSSRIVIGTSLHVRIVAAAYGLPRVTMRRVKPTRYAAHWDPHMPYDVRVRDLPEAIDAALAAGADPEVAAATERLTQLADDNLRAIVARVGEILDRGVDAERLALAQRRREGCLALARESVALGS